MARCAGTFDVVTALELAREHGLEVSDRGIQQIDRGLADIVARFLMPAHPG